MIATETTADGDYGAAFELPPSFAVENGDEDRIERAPIQVSCWPQTIGESYGKSYASQ
jgi:hypothetical protein